MSRCRRDLIRSDQTLSNIWKLLGHITDYSIPSNNKSTYEEKDPFGKWVPALGHQISMQCGMLTGTNSAKGPIKCGAIYNRVVMGDAETG